MKFASLHQAMDENQESATTSYAGHRQGHFYKEMTADLQNGDATVAVEPLLKSST